MMLSGSISITRTDRQTTINIKGRFNFEMHTLFRETYQEETRGQVGSRRFIFDLAGVEYIDSAALGMLLLLREETDANGANIEIVNARPEIHKILTSFKVG